MRIITFQYSDGKRSIGVRDGDEVVDLAKAAPDLPNDMLGFVQAGADAMSRAKDAASSSSSRESLDSVEVLVPLDNPPKILCVGRNYAAHAREGGAEPRRGARRARRRRGQTTRAREVVTSDYRCERNDYG